MDITTSGAVSAAIGTTQLDTASAVQVTMLKKAIDIQAQGALQLVQAASQVASSNPPHLGNSVDTFA